MTNEVKADSFDFKLTRKDVIDAAIEMMINRADSLRAKSQEADLKVVDLHKSTHNELKELLKPALVSTLKKIGTDQATGEISANIDTEQAIVYLAIRVPLDVTKNNKAQRLIAEYKAARDLKDIANKELLDFPLSKRGYDRKDIESIVTAELVATKLRETDNGRKLLETLAAIFANIGKPKPTAITG